MGYCGEHGIPHSDFLSWEPEDRSKALAWTIESRLRCQMCGTADWEWEENPRAYEPVKHVCLGCSMRDGFLDREEAQTPGITVVLVPPEAITHSDRVKAEKRRIEEALERRGG